MMAYLWIGIGGALGSMGRHACNGLIGRLAGVDFPWGTLVINVVGSLVIGVAASTMGSEGRFATTMTAEHPGELVAVGHLDRVLEREEAGVRLEDHFLCLAEEHQAGRMRLGRGLGQHRSVCRALLDRRLGGLYRRYDGQSELTPTRGK